MSKQQSLLNQQRQVYIYAEVDIDRLFGEIVQKGRRIKQFLQDHGLDEQFLQKMRNYKNLRITFDNEIQQFIYKKELNKQLKNIKKQVLNQLQDFLVDRFKKYVQEDKLKQQYEEKVNQIQRGFEKRIRELKSQYE